MMLHLNANVALHPRVLFTIHIDEGGQRPIGVGIEAARLMTGAERHLHDTCDDKLKLPIAPDKGAVLGTHQDSVARVHAELGVSAGKAVTEVRRIGVDFAAGLVPRRERLRVEKKCFNAFKLRRRRFARFGGKGGHAKSVFFALGASQP